MRAAPIQVRSLGRTADVGANAYLVTTEHCHILLDAGAATSDRLGWLDALDVRPDVPLFVWISHLHADHLGALPSLYQRHAHVQIVMTPLSAALMPAACRGLFKETHHSEHASQALAALSHKLPLRTRWRLPLDTDSPDAVYLTAFPCGHVPGAASLLLEVGREEKFHKIFYLPDFSTHLATLATPFDPRTITSRDGEPVRPDLLIMEGMLGSDAQANRLHIEEEMDALVHACIIRLEQRRGGQLIAAQGLGVALDVVHHLDAALTARGLQEELIVHDFLEPLFQPVERATARDSSWLASVRFMSLPMCEEMLLAGNIVVASDEHLSPGSPSRHLASSALEREDVRLFLFPGSRTQSLTRKILDASPGDTIKVSKKRRLTVRAERTSCHLPNHAPRRALLDAVTTLEPGRVALVHGSRNALLGLQSALRKHLGKKGVTCEVDVLQDGQILEL